MTTREIEPTCVYPVGCVYPGEGCTGPCADRDNPDSDLAEQQCGRHVYDDRSGGVWSHPGTREECPMPECGETKAER